MLSNKAVVHNYLADNRSSLLFDNKLLSLLIGPPAREGDLFLFSIGDHNLIDEFSAVVGINP
jgi:hypothetical protein